jgi:hypothetical protein
MSVARSAVLRHNRALIEWLLFAIQALIAVSVEVGDDLGRGMISQHGTAQGIENARRVVSFESAHGLFIEPAWQLFFQQTHRVLMWSITWMDVAHVMNGIYILGHVFVTLSVAVWIYMYHRRMFALLRNTIILTNLFALFVYESFPMAPPRMVGALMFDHHTFTFRDTLYGILNAGKVVGTQVGYNEFSAMPSVHMAWALVVGGALLVLARPLIFKLFGVVYPCLMLMAVVVTGNHFLLDAVGAVMVVTLAFAASLSLHGWVRRNGWAQRLPEGVI